MLRRSFQVIVIGLFAYAAISSSTAQESGNGEKFDELPSCFTSKIANRETKWFRHDLRIFSICLPETMVRRKTERCGERCFIFENEDLFFDADITGSAWRPTFEKRYASFSGANKPIDGKQSSVWYFEDTGKYKYVAGVNVIFERGQIGMGVYLFSKTSDPRPLAEKMFSSIKFVKPDYK